MKVSAKNQLKGKIVEVTKGGHRARVRIEVPQGTVITASITNDAAAELGLQKGEEAWAIVHASDVMIGK
jgi:molybdopterin-binding protein